MTLNTKILSGISLIFALAIFGKAQDKTMAEVIATSEKIVKGAPFSADATSESIQILSDGNKIIRKSTTKMYRDSEGRYRREETTQPGGALGSVIEMSPTILIIDPAAGLKYYLNPTNKTIRQSILKSNYDFKFKVEMNKQSAIEKKVEEKSEKKTDIKPKEITKENDNQLEIEKEKTSESIEQKKQRIADNAARRAESNARRVENNARRAEINVKRVEIQAKRAEKAAETFQKSSVYVGKTTTESLGVKTIEGVETEGIRSTTTIAAGAIGNERQIDIVYEKWYSKDLQLIVMSKHSDPRFGEQTYRLTNINRNEPEHSLFLLPTDYKILNEMPIPKNIKPPTSPGKQPAPLEKKPAP